MKAAYTIATANYLAQSKTTGLSFVKSNPDYQFIIFLLDKEGNEVTESEFVPLQIIEVEKASIDGFNEMLERYSAFELSNSLKPFLALYLFKNFLSIDNLIYIDSDVYVYGVVKEIDSLLIQNNIILTPHLNTPMPLDGALIDEKSILNSGLYNGGFVALKRSEEAFRFLDWWKERLFTECIVDFSKGLFVDQIWLNLVPVYFKGVYILQNPGYNMAHWNLYERKVSVTNSVYYVNERYPLVFFHFSGFDFNKPHLISKYQTRYDLALRNDLVELFRDYFNAVIENGYHTYVTIPWFYGDKKIIPEISKKIEDQRILAKLATRTRVAFSSLFKKLPK